MQPQRPTFTDRLSLPGNAVGEEELGKAGVTVRYVMGDYRDDDEGRLQNQIRAALSEYEKAKILERTGRGKQAKARRGLVVGSGGIAYGYRCDGNGGLVVEEREAHLFGWCSNGTRVPTKKRASEA